MRKKQNLTKTKGEKFASWMKEKRFYIVLLCCIMTVSATYFIAESLQPKRENTQSKSVKPSSTPLPDLTNNYPPPVSTSPTASPKPSHTPSINKIVSKKTPSSTSAPSSVDASADTQAVYEKREKTTLSYPVNGEIITPHSTEALIFSKTLGDWRTHDGIDIKAQLGTDVKAADDGVIESVYTDDFFGITIVIDHQNGLKSTYANLSNSALVQSGQAVARGDIISAVGDTALCEAAEVGHLHFEVSDAGEGIDPMSVLEN